VQDLPLAVIPEETSMDLNLNGIRVSYYDRENDYREADVACDGRIATLAWAGGVTTKMPSGILRGLIERGIERGGTGGFRLVAS
jgi:hypothetical protein